MVAFTAGSVLTAANLNSAFNALTIRTVTGTSDTLVLADNGGAVTYSNASPVSVTVPLFSSIAYATGTKIVLVNLGAGTVTVAGAGGVTVNGSPLTLAQNAGATLIKTATNTWSFLPFSSGSAAAVISSTTGSPTITTDGAATVYNWTGDGTIVVGTEGLVTLLVIGGGGGGTMGGGGAGAHCYMQGVLSAGTHTIRVGPGGAGGGPSGTTGYLGLASACGEFQASGGGGGAVDAGAGVLGGSGGGGGENSGAAGSGIAPSGFAGGAGYSGTGANRALGGGGGAGAVGSPGTVSTGGNGGVGLATTITGHRWPTAAAVGAADIRGVPA